METSKKRSKKETREQMALLGLVELYLKTGKPIGSSTLKESGFEDLSSATLRNYFSRLEKEGYLKQPHSSGGRIPTSKAFRFYAEEMLHSSPIEPEDEDQLASLKGAETKNLTAFLQNANELLSNVTGFATFLSSVRFDHDFILDVKLVSIDANRVLCVLITNFGQILTETFSSDHKLSSFTLKRLEGYFLWRLEKQKTDKPPHPLNEEEAALAQKFYNEMMIRYIVRYSNFSDAEIHRTGFSKLLTYPEFNDPLLLTSALSLFENGTKMRHLLNDCIKTGKLTFWIGEDLNPYLPSASICSVIAIPYKINHVPVGAIGLLGPSRMPYRSLFGIMNLFSEYLSEAITRSLYKFKLTFRQPNTGNVHLDKQEWTMINQTPPHLLEIKEKP